MSAKEDEFTKLFKYMERRFDEVAVDVKAVKTDVEAVQGTLDAVLKQRDEENSDVLALHSQVDRHERYFDTVAGVLDIDLDAVKT